MELEGEEDLGFILFVEIWMSDVHISIAAVQKKRAHENAAWAAAFSVPFCIHRKIHTLTPV